MICASGYPRHQEKGRVAGPFCAAFLQKPFRTADLLSTIERALALFGDKPAWTALQRRAMTMDFSWERSAKLYGDLYQQLSETEAPRGR